MVSTYYRRRSAADKRVYRRSDGVGSIRLPRAAALQALRNSPLPGARKVEGWSCFSPHFLAGVVARAPIRGLKTDDRGQISPQFSVVGHLSSKRYAPTVNSWGEMRARATTCMGRGLAVSPHDDWGELHGLYSPEEGRRRSASQLRRHTAHRKLTVAFRTCCAPYCMSSATISIMSSCTYPLRYTLTDSTSASPACSIN